MQFAPQSTVSSDFAALFTKANFLLSTGLVTRSAYDRCVGHLKLPGNGAGVFVYGIDNEAEQLKRSFTDRVKVGIGKHESLEEYVFTYSVTGSAEFGAKEYPANVNLRLAIAPESKNLSVVSWPRGIFNLRTLGNRFEVELPDAPAGTFIGIEGVVLISYANNQRIEGSVFLQKAVRVHAPLPVPQTGLPLRFIFRAEK